MLAIYLSLILQLPIGTPNPDDNKPLDLTDPFELIVFIIIPIIVVILYIIWKKNKKKGL